MMQPDTAFRDVNLAALAPTGDALLAELNRLREIDPLYWSEASHCWIVGGHAEVTEDSAGRCPCLALTFRNRSTARCPSRN